tara:strand:- start:6421 stop:6888 length:468 start_codon:yes stop_codon:yes gene_type:complete
MDNSTNNGIAPDADSLSADKLQRAEGLALLEAGNTAATPTAPDDAPIEDPDSGIDATGRPWKRVHLDNALKRPGPEITKVILRKPIGGDLRGTKLVDVYNMDVVAMSLVIPRISEPTIHRPEFMTMDGEDIASLSSEVVNFLLTRSQKAEAGLNG